MPAIRSTNQTSESQIKIENPENCVLDQMLYGDIDPTIKLEDVLKPLKEAKTSTADKPADAG